MVKNLKTRINKKCEHLVRSAFSRELNVEKRRVDCFASPACVRQSANSRHWLNSLTERFGCTIWLNGCTLRMDKLNRLNRLKLCRLSDVVRPRFPSIWRFALQQTLQTVEFRGMCGCWTRTWTETTNCLIWPVRWRDVFCTSLFGKSL